VGGALGGGPLLPGGPSGMVRSRGPGGGGGRKALWKLWGWGRGGGASFNVARCCNTPKIGQAGVYFLKRAVKSCGGMFEMRACFDSMVGHLKKGGRTPILEAQCL